MRIIFLGFLLWLPWEVYAAADTGTQLVSDAGRSRLVIAVSFEGIPVEGEFKQFQVKAVMTPAGFLSTLDVTIETASLDFHNSDINHEIGNPQWLDSAKFPTARFLGEPMVEAGSRYSLTGQLTLKGRTVPVTVSMTTTSSGTSDLFLEGEATIDRTAFSIGTGDWSANTPIGHQVTVSFAVTLVGKP